MSEIVFAVEQPPEAGWVARAVGHSIFTEADTEADLRAAVRDAVRCHFDGGTAPSLVRLHFAHDQVLAA